MSEPLAVREAPARYQVELESQRVRPGYKQTEVGVIPEDWEVLNLESIADPKRTISYGIVQTGPSISNGIKCLRVVDIADGKISSDDMITTSKTISDSYKRTILKAEDLVMPLRGKVGEIAIISEDLAGSNLTRGVALIAVRSDWSSRYCRQYISSSSTKNRLEQSMNGSALQEIPIATLRSFKIALPPTKAEQEAIAEALSDADALIEALEQLIAKKRNLKQGAMQELLTGKKRLPGFSGKWEVKRLEDVVITIPGGIYGVENLSDGLVPMPVATTAHISDDDQWNGKAMQVRYFTGNQIATYAVQDGDLVVVKSSGSAASIKSGKIGLVSKVEAGSFVFSNFLMVLRPKAVISKYLYFYQTSYNVKKLLPSLVEASTYPNIRRNEYLAIDIPLPPKEEQTAIATLLSDMDTEIAALETRLAKTRSLKQGMMHNLLTGKIRLV